ncbi:nicotinamide riboside transporter PnuC [Microbacterium sp.]|uniref:nicotinamide riboside transporter PnuC n=1 Tax=Microbacterium sp. TaxID=51671 RepID=UPI00281180D5|nr:nicotinamide riboside transporter PnuC [Microbacterium sp.]
MGEWLAQHWIDIAGFATGAACVFLSWRRSVWNFPIGIANAALFLVVTFQAALFATAGLQVVFIVLSLLGWLEWARARAAERRAGVARDEAFVRRTPRRTIVPLAASGGALTALLTWLLASYTPSTLPLPDAAVVAGSLIAQFMLNRRWIQSWYVWIAVDVAYVAIYAATGLWLFAVLYLGFIAMCIAGLLSWRSAERDAASAAGEPEPAYA